MFETKEVVNDSGVTFNEYINFPDSIRGYLDFALLHSAKECLVYEGERYTYKEVFEKSAQTGNALIKEGIKKGDKVAICMQNNPEFIFAYLGIVGIGAVCVPLNSWWIPSEVIYGLEHSDAKLLFADKKRMQGLESLENIKKIVTTYTPDSSFKSFSDFIKEHSTSFPEVDINRNDHATIYYTSGSTGKPKGVLSSQKAIISTVFSWACFSSIMKEVDAQKKSNHLFFARRSFSNFTLCSAFPCYGKPCWHVYVYFGWSQNCYDEKMGCRNSIATDRARKNIRYYRCSNSDMGVIKSSRETKL